VLERAITEKIWPLQSPWWGAIWSLNHVDFYGDLCTGFWIFGITYYTQCTCGCNLWCI